MSKKHHHSGKRMGQHMNEEKEDMQQKSDMHKSQENNFKNQERMNPEDNDYLSGEREISDAKRGCSYSGDSAEESDQKQSQSNPSQLRKTTHYPQEKNQHREQQTDKTHKAPFKQDFDKQSQSKQNSSYGSESEKLKSNPTQKQAQKMSPEDTHYGSHYGSESERHKPSQTQKQAQKMSREDTHYGSESERHKPSQTQKPGQKMSPEDTHYGSDSERQKPSQTQKPGQKMSREDTHYGSESEKQKPSQTQKPGQKMSREDTHYGSDSERQKPSQTQKHAQKMNEEDAEEFVVDHNEGNLSSQKAPTGFQSQFHIQEQPQGKSGKQMKEGQERKDTPFKAHGDYEGYVKEQDKHPKKHKHK